MSGARAVAVLALAFMAAVPSRSAEPPVCDRIVAVGDLHGGYEAFDRILHETRIVDEFNRWADPRACLIQLGDVVDRGGKPRKILDLLMTLEQQAPGRVQMLLGNHEIMDLVGDLRYKEKEEFEEFAVDETGEEREKGYLEFLKSEDPSGVGEADRKAFDERFPPGWFAFRREFHPKGWYGAWLLGRPTMALVGGTLFVHGGVTEALARVGIDALNRSVIAEVRDYLRLRDQLTEYRWLRPLMSFSEGFDAVRTRLREMAASGEPPRSADEAETVAGFLQITDGKAFRPDGPFWNRELATLDDTQLAATLPKALYTLGASRVVAAHNPEVDGRIRSRLDGLVYLIDTGAGPAYHGTVSALELQWHGRVRGIYPGWSAVLSDPPMSDADTERFLMEGRIVESKEIGTGGTRPRRVVLDVGGRTLPAAFKTALLFQTRLTNLERSGLTLHFSESYRHEQAAYLLDRWLGIGMVPPTVVRTIEGETGALIDWVADAIDEKERRDRGLVPPDPRVLVRQRDAMHVFDALIHNTDRNLGNQLVTIHDWKLHLIDHSRCFGLELDLPEEFLLGPAGLTRPLLAKIEALREKPLLELLHGVASRAQVKAILARRSRILAKIAEDRKKYGDAAIFDEGAPPLDR